MPLMSCCGGGAQSARKYVPVPIRKLSHIGLFATSRYLIDTIPFSTIATVAIHTGTRILDSINREYVVQDSTISVAVRLWHN